MSPPVHVVCAAKAPAVHRALAAAPGRGSCGGGGRRSTQGEASKTFDAIDRAVRSAQAVLQPEGGQSPIVPHSLNVQNINAMRRPGGILVKPPKSPRTAATKGEASCEDVENQEPPLAFAVRAPVTPPVPPDAPVVRLETTAGPRRAPLAQCGGTAGPRVPLGGCSGEAPVVAACRPLTPRGGASAGEVWAWPVGARPLTPRGDSSWEAASASSRAATPRAGDSSRATSRGSSRPLTPRGEDAAAAPRVRPPAPRGGEGGEGSRATSAASSRPCTPRGEEAAAPARGWPAGPARGGDGSRATSAGSSRPCTPRGEAGGQATPVVRGRPPTPRGGDSGAEVSSAARRLPTPRGGEGGGEATPAARGPKPRSATPRANALARRASSLAEARRCQKEQVCAEDRAKRFDIYIMERLDEVVHGLTPR